MWEEQAICHICSQGNAQKCASISDGPVQDPGIPDSVRTFPTAAQLKCERCTMCAILLSQVHSRQLESESRTKTQEERACKGELL